MSLSFVGLSLWLLLMFVVCLLRVGCLWFVGYCLFDPDPVVATFEPLFLELFDTVSLITWVNVEWTLKMNISLVKKREDVFFLKVNFAGKKKFCWEI